MADNTDVNRMTGRMDYSGVEAPSEMVSGMQRLGSGTPAAPGMNDGWRAGLEGIGADFDYARAAMNVALGDLDTARDAQADAEEHTRAADFLLKNGTSFEDVYSDPSFGGAKNWAATTLGQLGPSAIESVAAGLVGALVGTAATPGAGTAAGGLTGVARTALVKTSLRQYVRTAVAKKAQGRALTAAEDAVATGAIKSFAAKKSRAALMGGTAASFADEYIHGVGQVTAEQMAVRDNDISQLPLGETAGAAGAYAALGTLSERFAMGAAFTAFRHMGKTGADAAQRTALRKLGSGVAGAGLEAGTETAQEGLLVGIHAAATGDGYEKTPEARKRLIESAAAGFLGGGAMQGGIHGTRVVADQLIDAGRTVGDVVMGKKDSSALFGPHAKWGLGDAMKKAGVNPRGAPGQRFDASALMGDFMTPPHVDGDGFVMNSYDDVDLPDSTQENVMPEPQRDIDAQFDAMNDPLSAKQAVEITEGSPMPSQYDEDDPAIHRATTKNGVLLTRDPEMAAQVDSGIMTTSKALGYRAPKSRDGERALAVRDDAGRLRHYEMLADDETDEQAVSRGQGYNGRAEITTPKALVDERRQALTDEGRDADEETLTVAQRRANAHYQSMTEAASALDNAIQTGSRAYPRSQLREALLKATDKRAQAAARLRDVSRQLSDHQARKQKADQAETEARAKRVSNLTSGLSMLDEGNPNGVRVTDNLTGEAMMLDEAHLGNALRSDYDTEGNRGDLEYDPIERAREQAFDELEEQGYTVERTDRPLPVVDMGQGDMARYGVQGTRLDYDSPATYASKGKTAGADATRQILNRGYTAGPNTETTMYNGRRMPVAAVRKAREMQAQYPNDSWSIARHSTPDKDDTYYVQRDRGMTERTNDESTVRGNPRDAASERTLTNPTQVDAEAEAASGLTQGATEHILKRAEAGRWKSRRQKAPFATFNIYMVDPKGTPQVFSRRVLEVAGADVNPVGRGMKASERGFLGLTTALGVLLDKGYTFDPKRRTDISKPKGVFSEKTWEAMDGQERDRVVETRWESLSPTERVDFLDSPESTTDYMPIGSTQRDQTTLAQAMTHDQLGPEDVTRLLDYSPDRMNTDEDAEGPAKEYEDGTAKRPGRKNTYFRSPEGNARVVVDPHLTPELADLMGAMHLASDLQNTVAVFTTQTTNDVFAGVPNLTDADKEFLRTSPLMQELINPSQRSARQRGRVIFLPSGAHAIWINDKLNLSNQMFTLAHETGHAVYTEHFQSLVNDEKQYNRLYNEFLHKRDEAPDAYGDQDVAFEEWYADRYAAWVNGQLKGERVANLGFFNHLRKRLRAVVQSISKFMRTTADPKWRARMRSSNRFNAYMDGIARTTALRHAEQRLMAEVDANPFPRRSQDSPQTRLNQVRAQLAARTALGPMRNYRVGDKLAREQEARLRQHALDQFLAEPRDVIEDPNIEESTYVEDLPMDRGAEIERDARRPAAPADEDIRPAQTYTPAEDTEAETDLRGPKEYTRSEPEPDDIRPARDYTPESQAGSGGNGSGDGGGGRNRGPQTAPPEPEPESRGTDVARKDRPAQEEDDLLKGRGRNERTKRRRRDDPLNWTEDDPFGPHTPPDLSDAYHWLRTTFPKMAGGLTVLRDLTWSDDSRLRTMGDPGAKLASMFWTPPGERKRSVRGYFNAVESELAYHMERFDTLMPSNKGLAEQALREAQSETPTVNLSGDARKIREGLEEFYSSYAERHIRGISMRKNYFPRVYDFDEIVARPKEFAALIDKYVAPGKGEVLTREMLRDTANVEMTTDDQQGAAPGMGARLTRELFSLPDSALQEAGFVAEPRTALMSYLRHTVRRAEYARRFEGTRPVDQVIKDMERRQAEARQVDTEYLDSLKELRQRGGAQYPVYDPSAAINEQIDKLYDKADKDTAHKIVQNYMGRSNTLFGKQITPGISRTFATLSAVGFASTLSLAALSSVTDFGAMVMRSKTEAGFKDLYDAAAKIPAKDRLALATAIGSISAEANLEALRMSYGSDFMTPRTRKFTDTYFKVIGLEAITNFNRSVATQMGYQFLLRHEEGARNGEYESKRYLAELGLTADDIAAWRKGKKGDWDFESEAGERVRQALFQFTDESVLRPNAAQRPGWASNPWFALVWQLKSFAYGMSKTVISGMANEVQARYQWTGRDSAALAPMVIAGAVMFPLAYLAMGLRDIVKDGLNEVFDDDEYQYQVARDRSVGEWLVELTDRSGMMGPLTIVNTVMDADNLGVSPFMAPLGPVPNLAVHAVTDPERALNDVIPVAGMVR